jgi:hypothetical protein
MRPRFGWRWSASRRCGRPVRFPLPALDGAADLPRALGAVLAAIADGAVTPDEGLSLAQNHRDAAVHVRAGRARAAHLRAGKKAGHRTMIGLQRRVARLERRFAPDADDPLGALSDEELEQSIRLLRASIEGGKAAATAVWAQLDPMVADKIALLLERTGQDNRGAAFERSQGER